MNDLLPTTNLLYCSWLVSGRTEEEKTGFPTSVGILDHALKQVVDEGQFPEWMRRQLHFVDSNLGLICEELPYIQKLATNAKLTSDPNPSYTTSEIVVGEMFANRCLAKMGVSKGDAAEWGRALRAAVLEISDSH
jgi:hypothetical protein